MLADGLVDELNLFVYPLVLGSGVRLFGDSPVKFTLAQTRSYDNGVLYLAYRPSA
jgi:riboflavin biosynthesis pyrimidine reductase